MDGPLLHVNHLSGVDMEDGSGGGRAQARLQSSVTIGVNISQFFGCNTYMNNFE